ncbi:uncharacterized membrane protein At1g75140-like isoform X1 [Salvia miltiorrhiza]|uniref:uncharacterized membrane protein At1g75140-like isoform X1 n=2 Tax=Salvia miltiorrhiza TaxID=226208 RepID=UPI0025ABC459|nr:uncharacterized membrane protein At1g75140-like isoform X1 [Salvia miltiorrhiza]
MAVPRRKGKLVFALTVSLLLAADLFCFPRLCCVVLASSESDPSVNSNSVIETDYKNDIQFKQNDIPFTETCVDYDLVRKQQLQLEKFQELVKNLTQLVDRLESRFSDDPGSKRMPSLSSYDDDEKSDSEKIKDSGKGEMRGGGGMKSGPLLVTKYNTFWAERFQFVSAVKLRSSPSCVNVLPNKDFEGLSKYFAVGDDKGKLYLFLRSGEVALEFDAFSEADKPSPISAIVSYLSVYKNETMIVTGHVNGAIVMHRVWETFSGDEWSSLHVERVGRFEMPESWGLRISMMEVHHVGRRRYILATDEGGKIMVFKEDGMLYGTATPSKKPIAFLKQRLLFLMETGAGSLDLRTMKLKETECEGLNSSLAKSYVFDAMDRSKAYGLTKEGDLVQTLLLGDVMNFKCRVRSKRKLDMDEPLALQAIKGYLLIANREKVYVYNVSSQHYVRAGGLRLLFSAGLDEIIAPFLNQQHGDVNMEERMGEPMITSDHEKLVIISLGNGYVAMYRSNLPVFKNEFNSILWTSPVLFFILFLFGAWQCFANKKEALTSWGPDDPFTSASVTSGAPLGSATGDRSFTDSSRNSEIMELRGSGLRGSSRYVSPPRYSGGAPNPYRPGGSDTDSRPAANHYRPSADTDSRPATNHYRPSPDTDARSSPVDPRFRTAELKYRGSNVEASAVPKRRDSLFVNSQVVDDSN